MARSDWGTAFLNLFFPEKDRCLFCAEEDQRIGSLKLCRDCSEAILQITEEVEVCPVCGYFTAGAKCPTCRSWREKFLEVTAVVPYEGVFREMLHDFKFNGKKDLAEPLGFLMATRLRRLRLVEKIAVIIPVPLYEVREEQRGFNQSLLLAQVIAQEIQKPLWQEALDRKHFRQPQMILTREERMRNIAGAFNFSQKKELPQGTILLVDDVITTGATLLACATILRQAGAPKVQAVTWAAGYNVKLLKRIIDGNFFMCQQ